MKIGFELEPHESKVTPMKVADALIDSEQFGNQELKELSAYLSAFTRYNHGKESKYGKL